MNLGCLMSACQQLTLVCKLAVIVDGKWRLSRIQCIQYENLFQNIFLVVGNGSTTTTYPSNVSTTTVYPFNTTTVSPGPSNITADTPSPSPATNISDLGT